MTKTLRERRLEEAREQEATLLAALAQTQRRRAALEAVVEYTEPSEDGAVIRWTVDWHGREYTYVALRANGQWFTTALKGRAAGAPLNWGELEAIWEDAGGHLQSIQAAGDWTTLPTN